MTDHPLTETAAAELSKKFMPGVAFQMLANVSPEDLTEYARAAFNAGREHERTNPADARPWEPLNEHDPLNVGDEVWRWWCGVSTRGIFDVQHPDSQVYTAERGHLGHRAIGTWCVRRAAPESITPGTWKVASK